MGNTESDLNNNDKLSARIKSKFSNKIFFNKKELKIKYFREN